MATTPWADATYSIVIPAVDEPENCKELLRSLLSSLQWGKYNCPVLVCWDAAKQETIDAFEKEFPFITSLPHFGDRLNFCRNSNRGLRYAHQELHTGAFLVNMDTVLPAVSALEKIINNGISSPRAHHVDGEAVAKFYQLNKLADPSCPCNKDLKGPDKVPTVKFAAFCMWVSKYAFSKIGYLDEGTFVASFEDDDYCLRAALAGLPVEQYEIPVHHELKNREIQISTTGAYDAAQLGDHMVRFARKWGIPGNIPHEQFARYILNNRMWDDKWKVR